MFLLTDSQKMNRLRKGWPGLFQLHMRDFAGLKSLIDG